MLAVEKLLARLEINVQILRRVVVVHILRHVKFHAADQIHRRLERVQVHEQIAVHLKAQKLRQRPLQPLHALDLAAGVDRVDLDKTAAGVDGRIARDAQQRRLLFVHVQVGDDDGIGAVAVAVRPGEQDVVNAVQIADRLLRLDRLLRRLVRVSVRTLHRLGLHRQLAHGLPWRVGLLGWADIKMLEREQSQHQRRQHSEHDEHDPRPSGHSAGPLRLFAGKFRILSRSEEFHGYAKLSFLP